MTTTTTSTTTSSSTTSSSSSATSPSTTTISSNDCNTFGFKAGIIDRDKINKKIHSLSKNSAYYKNEKRKRDLLIKKVDSQLKELDMIKRQQKMLNTHKMDIKELKTKVNKLIDNHLNDIELNKATYFFIDFDSFYSSVELLDHPELNSKPVAIGSETMICTANYIARKYGVRSAMPGFIALQICPKLLFIKPNFEKYQLIAKKAMEIFELYDEHFQSYGLDECSLNITSYKMNHPELNVQEIALDIQQKIKENTNGLTISIGIASSISLAKLASNVNKPNGIYQIQANKVEILSFLNKLKVRKLNGIGKRLELLLEKLQIYYVQDIRNGVGNSAYLKYILKPKTYNWLLLSSLGIDNVKNDVYIRKSYSKERTLAKVVETKIAIRAILYELCIYLYTNDIQANHLRFKTVTIKLKKTNFMVINRSITLKSFISTDLQLMKIIDQILDQKIFINNIQIIPVRLIGLKISNFDQSSTSLEQHSSSISLLMKQLKDKTVHIPQQEDVKQRQKKKKKKKKKIDFFTNQNPKKSKSKKKALIWANCPICNKIIEIPFINKHLDSCVG